MDPSVVEGITAGLELLRNTNKEEKFDYLVVIALFMLEELRGLRKDLKEMYKRQPLV